MADVTGSIGNEPVELNNAATEATLKLLLQATLSANRQTLESVRNIAQNSGLNAETVAAANENLSRLASGTTKTGAALGAVGVVADQVKAGLSKVADVTKEITSGTGNVSGVFDIFAKLPGVLGAVFSGMQKLAAYQESLLQSYQTISSAGVNFGGSLTEMRQAAANSFLTLDQFTNLLKTNGDALARMGGTVDQGARSFVKMSNVLLSGELGASLRALGYTTEQVNQGFLSYIETTGGRNRQEIKNTAELTKGAQEYLVQLDGLAQLTGKSRQEQENALKVANQNAAIQAKLATMDEAQKKAYLRGLAEMSAKHGKAGIEMYQSQILGLPPMTAASQQLTALAPEIAAASRGMADVALRGGSAAETFRYSAQATQGAIQAADRFKNVAGAMSFQGGATADAMMAITKAANLARQQGRETDAEELEARAKILEEQKTRQESEAAQAVATQEAMQKLGQELLTKLLPIVSSLWNVMNPLVTTVTNVLTAMLKIPYLFETLGAALVVAIGAMAIVRARAAVAAVGSMFGGGMPPGGRAGPPVGSGGPPGGAGRAAGAAGGAGRAAGGALGGIGAGLGSGVGAALTGLSTGLISLANPRAMLGTVTLGLLSGSLLISAKAFKEFTGVSWKDVGIATLAITGLAAGAAALSFIAPAILIGSAALGALGGAIWLLAKGLKEFPTDVFPSINVSFGALGDIVSDVFGAIDSVISSTLTVIKSTFGFVWDVISYPFNQIGSVVSASFNAVSGLVTGLYNGIKSTFGFVWDVISYPFKQLGSVVSASFNAVSGLVTGLYNGIKSTFGSIWDVISYPFNQIGSVVSASFNAISGLVTGLYNGIKSTFGSIWDVISYPFNQIGSLVSGAFDGVSGLVTGLYNGIKSTFGFVWDVISYPFNQIGSVVSTSFDGVTASVSKLFDGIKSTFGSIWDVISYPFNQIGSLVSGAFNRVTASVSKLFDGIKSTFGSIWDVISYPFNQIVSLVTAPIETVKGIFSGLFSNVSSVFSGITSSVKAVGEFISGTFKWVIDKVTNFLSLIKGAISAVAGLLGMGSSEKSKESSSLELSSASSILLDAAKNLKLAAEKLLLLSIEKSEKGRQGNQNVSADISRATFEKSAISDKMIQAMASILPTGKGGIDAFKSSVMGLPPQLASGLSPAEFAIRYSSERKSEVQPRPSTELREIPKSDKEKESFPARIAAVTIETLNTQLITLNKQSEEMLKYIKESTDYARRTVDATRALNPNLLKR